ncbi:hypothetical protein [Rheinheimera baltica]|uniref:LpxL/LpxP family acyltransferase n=1 Tax=Rheinheimera baltica TaxID=67576 RepID=UPI0003FF2A79|nr:hypothetical protein [Rheinheimera baltica]
MVESELQREMQDYYRMNFKGILGDKFTENEVSTIADQAFHCKFAQQLHFDDTLACYIAKFQQKDYAMRPYLSGWDCDYIHRLVNHHGGLLLGLFHYGAHRHILLDLVTMNIPSVAPIAGKAYEDLQQLVAASSPDIASQVSLIEVEDDQVSRSVFKSLKSGRVGGIYVDGNMGPTSSSSTQSTVNVNYFNYSIAVKAGIARLSMLLNFPILPVMSSASIDAPHVNFGRLIEPNIEIAKNGKQQAPQHIMQTLYAGLENAVLKAPSSWEFAHCLHRWIQGVAKHTTFETSGPKPFVTTDIGTVQFLAVNTKTVSSLYLKGELYWVNTKLAKGFKIPASLSDVFSQFYHTKRMPVITFKTALIQQGFIPQNILDQLVLNELVHVG